MKNNSSLKLSLTALLTDSGKEQVPFKISMAIGNVVLMSKCCPRHLRIGTTMKKDIETKGEKIIVKMERHTAGR